MLLNALMGESKLQAWQIQDAKRLKTAWQKFNTPKRKITQEAAADLLGFSSQSTVSQYLNADIPLNIPALVGFSGLLDVEPQSISPTLAAKIAGIQIDAVPENKRLLHGGLIDLDHLNREIVPTYTLPQVANFKSVIVSDVQPSKGNELSVRQRAPSKATFRFQVKGDSNHSASGRCYPDGMLVYVDPTKASAAMPGDRVLASVDGLNEPILREIRQEGGRLYLAALNKDYPPIHDQFSVIGVVVLGVQEE